MIKSVELRKGNLLNWSLKLAHPQTTLPDEMIEVFVVLEDKIAYVYPNIENRVEPFEDDVVQMGNGTVPFTEIEPIPLTEEWLSKAGFEINDGAVSLKSNVNLQFDWDGKHLTAAANPPLEYLHQLQNFYGDATGSPLEIAP